jgi:hypothetical protein
MGVPSAKRWKYRYKAAHKSTPGISALDFVVNPLAGRLCGNAVMVQCRTKRCLSLSRPQQKSYVTTDERVPIIVYRDLRLLATWVAAAFQVLSTRCGQRVARTWGHSPDSVLLSLLVPPFPQPIIKVLWTKKYPPDRVSHWLRRWSGVSHVCGRLTAPVRYPKACTHGDPIPR